MPIVADKLVSAQPYIPNLRVVSDTLFRGGQPAPEGLRLLKEAGIRTIVNLCGTGSLLSLFKRSSTGGAGPVSESPEVADERQRAQQLGLGFIAMPMEVFGQPPEGIFDQFVALLSDSSKHPVFIHCQHGRDRTGLMMGIYRVVCEGWDAEKAYSEMVECGFDAERTNLRDALFAFAERRSQGRGG